jgi:hypothetical protein
MVEVAARHRNTDHVLERLVRAWENSSGIRRERVLGKIADLSILDPDFARLVMRWYHGMLTERGNASMVAMNSGITVAHAIAENAEGWPAVELFQRHFDTMFLLTSDRERFVLSDAVRHSPTVARIVAVEKNDLLRKRTPRGESIAFAIVAAIETPYLFEDAPAKFNEYVGIIQKMIGSNPKFLNDYVPDGVFGKLSIAKKLYMIHADGKGTVGMQNGDLLSLLRDNSDAIEDESLRRELRDAGP